MNEIVKKIENIISLFKDTVEKPWYKLYGNNVPRSIEYSKGSIYDSVKSSSNKYPLYKAYTYFGKSCRYIKFNKEIVNLSKSLKYIGVKRGERITICMPNTPDAVIMFYAINAIGCIANMIHPLSSEKEIEFYLNKSKSKYILCLDDLYPKIKNIINNTCVEKIIISKVSNRMPIYLKIVYPLTKKNVKIKYDSNTISFNRLERMGKHYKGKYLENVKNYDDAVILYSGGTTGDAKGVVLSNLNFNALAMQCFNMVDPAKAGDSILTIMPIFHGFGIGVSVHTELSNGMHIILIPKFKSSEFGKLIKKYKPNFLAGVPTMYEALISSNIKSKTYLKSVCNAICGGDILNETLRNRVDTYLKEHGSVATIRVGYGLTESTAAVCVTPRYYFKEGAIGIPLPDMNFKIVKIGTETKLKANNEGEICINGPTVMKRYLDDINETRKSLRLHSDGKVWLHTGDIGYMDEDGIVFFKSRLKRIIVSSGYNIYPQYLEKIIMSHPSVLTCTVIGIPHKYKGQVPKAYVVLRKNFCNNDNLKEEIKEYVKKSIAKYSLPYEYEYVDEIPKTKVGKVAFTKLK